MQMEGSSSFLHELNYHEVDFLGVMVGNKEEVDSLLDACSLFRCHETKPGLGK